MMIIKNKNIEISILEDGFTFQQINFQGKDLLLEFANQAEYQNNYLHLNDFVGPVGGRIKQGKYQGKNKSWSLDINENPFHLHGGENSWHKLKYHLELQRSDTESVLTGLAKQHNKLYESDYEIEIKVSLQKGANFFTIEYTIRTSQEALINPTHHFYFNYGGNDFDPFKAKVSANNLKLILNNKMQPYKEKSLKVVNSVAEIAKESQLVVHNRQAVNNYFTFDKGKTFDLFFDTFNISVKSSIASCILYTSQDVKAQGAFKNSHKDYFYALAMEFQRISDVSFLDQSFDPLKIVYSPEKPYHEVLTFTFQDVFQEVEKIRN